MPYWLHKLLFGAQRVDDDVTRESGARVVGGFDAPYRDSLDEVRAKAIRVTDDSQDPTASRKVQISDRVPGLLDKFKRVPRSSKPA